MEPSVLTFDPHPAAIVAPERAPRLLSTPLERCAWMAEEGIRQVLILPFTPELSGLDPERFCERILAGALKARGVLIGANFRFGRAQVGDTETLARLGTKYDFIVEVIEGVVCRGRMVSSSELRRLLRQGDVSLANRLLGRPYAVSGAVVPGAGIGSRLTVPTLNLRTEAGLLPATGVYITRTLDLDGGRNWASVTNVGYRPTFHGRTSRSRPTCSNRWMAARPIASVWRSSGVCGKNVRFDPKRLSGRSCWMECGRETTSGERRNGSGRGGERCPSRRHHCRGVAPGHRRQGQGLVITRVPAWPKEIMRAFTTSFMAARAGVM
jgi:riboflavin kinase/FMN adenylyltransferase